MNDSSIRASRSDDLAAVDALLARSYPKLLKADYPPSVLVTALPLISRAQPALLASGTYYVAELDGQIVGAGGWTHDRNRAGVADIRHLVSDDRLLRRGIARAILTHAIAVAKSEEVRVMLCSSTRTAVPFYAALGFVAQGPAIMTLAQGIEFPIERMQLSLYG